MCSGCYLLNYSPLVVTQVSGGHIDTIFEHCWFWGFGQLVEGLLLYIHILVCHVAENIQAVGIQNLFVIDVLGW